MKQKKKFMGGKMANRHKVWTDEKLNRVKDLTQNNTSSEIGKIFGTTKNAVLGALYRDKVKNGYVPPLDSKYSIKKPNYPKHLERIKNE